MVHEAQGFISSVGGGNGGACPSAFAQCAAEAIVCRRICRVHPRSERRRPAYGYQAGIAPGGLCRGENLVLQIRARKASMTGCRLMADLLAQKVDVIITQAPPATRAAKVATTTIPVVFGVGIDPVAEGLVASFARPGGNLTGVALLGSELMARRHDLMSELVPQARLFGLLVNPSVPNPWIAEVEALARAKGGGCCP